ncbi:MAG: lipopolysaccharide biosynthesis protein [Erysipelotrichaceae bacterium]
MNRVFISFFWKFLERIGSQGVQFLVSLVIARMVLPEEYGIVGLTTIFISIANVFIQSGFNSALIQKQKVDDLDYCSVFVFSFFTSILLFVILFIAAPSIAIFYNMGILKLVIRWLSITLVFGSINSIQIAKLTKEFRFKSMFQCSIISTVISGIVGIVLAFKGFGIWALVFQQVSNQILVTGIMFLITDWRPKFKYSSERVNVLFKFGSKILLSNLLNTVYVNLYGLFIGKVYSSAELGYYNRADQFPKVLITNIDGSIQSVLLPVMAEKQGNIDYLREMVRKSITLSSFILCPMMVGLSVCAENIILLVLGPKWISCVPYMQILCFAYMLMPVHTANLQAINAMGRSDIFLKLEIMKKIVGLLCLFISMPFGIMWMLYFKLLDEIIAIIINTFPNRKLLHYSLLSQIVDILPSIFLSIIMGLSVKLIGRLLSTPPALTLLLQIVFGIVVYISLAIIFKVKSIYNIKILLDSMISIKRKKDEL